MCASAASRSRSRLRRWSIGWTLWPGSSWSGSITNGVIRAGGWNCCGHGEGQRISPDDFLESLDKVKGSLRLAVISGCNTARTLYTGSFRDLARGILGRGVPAVAAMQFSLSDVGGKFAEAFYPKIIAGEETPEWLREAGDEAS
jgi:hypothetical protein